MRSPLLAVLSLVALSFALTGCPDEKKAPTPAASASGTTPAAAGSGGGSAPAASKAGSGW